MKSKGLSLRITTRASLLRDKSLETPTGVAEGVEVDKEEVGVKDKDKHLCKSKR